MRDKNKKSKYRLSFVAWGFITLFVAVPIDAIDFLFGWVPVLGTGMDIVVTGLAFIIAGPIGLIYIWEILAFGPFNLADGFIPTMTAIMLLMYLLGMVQPYKRFRGRNK